MTADQIVRLIYSFAIGALCGVNFGLLGIAIAISIVAVANLLGEAFGVDR